MTYVTHIFLAEAPFQCSTCSDGFRLVGAGDDGLVVRSKRISKGRSTGRPQGLGLRHHLHVRFPPQDIVSKIAVFEIQ